MTDIEDPAKVLKKRCGDYQDVFDSPQGGRVLEDLSEFCGAKKVSFDEDPYRTAFNEGMRRVYLRINGFLDMTDEQIKRMLKIDEVDDE